MSLEEGRKKKKKEQRTSRPAGADSSYSNMHDKKKEHWVEAEGNVPPLSSRREEGDEGRGGIKREREREKGSVVTCDCFSIRCHADSNTDGGKWRWEEEGGRDKGANP